MRKITYFTGSRSEYGLMRTLLKKMAAHPDIKLNLIVTGTHLSKKYGYSVNEIRADGFDILGEFDILEDFEDELYLVKAFGRCMAGVANALKKETPDIFLIQGDRSEALAATLSAAHLNIPIAHLSGGDLTFGGTIDDRARPAISDFAHIHFPSTKRSAEVLVKRGEEKWRVHFFGNPGINLVNEQYTDSKELAVKLGIDLAKDLIVVVQHPVEPHHAEMQMEETMKAVKESGLQAVVIYPNPDSGSTAIIDVIKKYEGGNIKAFKTLSRPDFVGLLRVAKALVGNSSCGIVETPSLNLPSVNIGERQSGREQMGNVINADHDKNKIADAIRKAIKMKADVDMANMPYYAEGTEEKIINLLLKVELNDRLAKKKWYYD